MIVSFTFGDFDPAAVGALGSGEGGEAPLELMQVHRPTGESRDQALYVPGRIDPIRVAQPRGPVRIVLQLHIRTTDHDTLRDALRALYAGLIAQSGPAQLVIDDEPDRYWWATLAEPIDPEEIAGSTADTFDVVFDADPYAYDTTIESNGEGTFDADFVVPQPCVVEVAGTLSDVTITLNGQEWHWEGSAAGLTVSSITGTWLEGTNPDTDLVGYLPPGWENEGLPDVDSIFPMLQPGSNTFAVTGGTGTVYWRRRSP